MLPSFVSNLIWGDESQSLRQQEPAEAEVDLTVCEAQDDWMVIECGNGPTGDANESESVCSETSEHSWIVAPSPRFRCSSKNSTLTHHSLEDLLIEHPTMSVYVHHNQPNDSQDNEKEENTPNPNTQKDPKDMQIQLRNQNTQLVLYRNQARHQLATQLGIPLQPTPIQRQQIEASPNNSNKTKSGKKNTDKQTFIRVSRGKKSFKIHQCGVKAGRRRC